MSEVFNDQFFLKNLGLSNSGDSANLPRHRWYEVKESFSPTLVTKALESAKCVAGDVVIDPFSGSGTVPLTAACAGFKSIGYEVNPFLAFVAKAKQIRCRPTTIDAHYPQIRAATEKGCDSDLEKMSTFCEKPGRTKWLFNREILRAFEGGWAASKQVPGEVRKLFRMALIGAAMDTCNATKDGKCLRYRKNWEKLPFSKKEFVLALESRLESIKSDVEGDCSPVNKSSIYLGDARALAQRHKSQFKLCVTSPPYLNSFDYSDVYRPELFLGKFVQSNPELMDIRLRTIRSHVQASWRKPKDEHFGALYRESIKTIKEREKLLWDDRIPAMIQAYFEDMKTMLTALKRRATADASLWMVVSTSAYAGVEIPVDLIIADIGVQAGWLLREVGVLRYLRTSGQHWNKAFGDDNGKPRLRESVVIFGGSRACRG